MAIDPTDLFHRYYGSLVRMLYRRIGDRDRAVELAQAVFTRAAEAPPDRPRAWLFAAALNLVREDSRRSGRHAPKLELVRRDDSLPSPPPDQRQRDAAAYRTALATLGERDREALLLHAEGFSYEEIADTVGLAKKAVGGTLARGRRALVEACRGHERGQHVAS